MTRSTKTRTASTFALTTLLLTTTIGPPASAGGARVPRRVALREIAEPTVITEPGDYVVTADLNALLGYCVISIEADDVDLDLNGFRLAVERGNLICASSVTRLSVHDGVLMTGQVGDDARGIWLQNVDGFVLSRLTGYLPVELAISVDNGRNGIIEDNSFLGSAEGISLTGTDIAIRRNVISTGIHVTGDRFRIASNSLTSTPEDPSDPGNITIVGNENLIEGNFAGALALLEPDSKHNLIQNNVFHAASGLVIHGQHNRILGNFSTSGSGFGLDLATDSANNVYGGNRSFGNSGVNCPSPAGNADFCDHGRDNVSLGDNYLPEPM